MAMWKVSCLLVLFHVFAPINTTCILELEAEDGDLDSQQMHRSAASGGLTVRLTETDDTLNVYFEILKGSDCLVVINNVAYSNDDEADFVYLSVDGSSLGSFTTFATSNNGQNWNEIRNTGPFGTSIGVTVGTYVLTVIAVLDSYGVEIDKVELALQCGENFTPENCPETVAKVVPDPAGDDADKLSTGEIVGIAFSVVGVVGFLISMLIAYICN